MFLKLDQTPRRSSERGAGQGHPNRNWAHSRAKRAIDVYLTLAALPVAILLGASAALASAAVFRANPIFRQVRRGLNGELITIYKIRSLPPTFPADVSKRDFDSTSLSTFSRRLRTTHLDELPQLVNVLRNEMSLVGPRPMIDGVLEQLPSDVQARRATVLPGITGPWQVSSMGSKPLHECADLDLRYAAHGSLKMDVKCMWLAITRSGGHHRRPETMRAELGGPTCQCVTMHRAIKRLPALSDSSKHAAVLTAQSASVTCPLSRWT